MFFVDKLINCCFPPSWLEDWTSFFLKSYPTGYSNLYIVSNQKALHFWYTYIISFFVITTHSDNTELGIQGEHSLPRYIYQTLPHMWHCFYSGCTSYYNLHHTFLSHNLQKTHTHDDTLALLKLLREISMPTMLWMAMRHVHEC